MLSQMFQMRHSLLIQATFISGRSIREPTLAVAKTNSFLVSRWFSYGVISIKIHNRDSSMLRKDGFRQLPYADSRISALGTKRSDVIGQWLPS